MKNILLEDVDYKRPSTIYTLSKIQNRALEDFSSYFDNKTILYLENFTDEKNLKEKIMFDKISYFLIKNNEEIIGFIEYTKEEKELLINEFYTLIEYKNKTDFSRIMDLIIKNTKKDLKFFINSALTDDIEIFNLLNLEHLSSQIRYIGSDKFLKEEVFIKKIL